MKLVRVLLIVTAAVIAAPAFAQGQSAAATNMQILRDKIKADKKLVVAANMALTDAEAKGFWPVYDAYQKDLEKINERLVKVVLAYAKEYNARTLTNDKAGALLDEALSIEDAEIKLKRSYVPRLAKVLPQATVARYIQIENKIRAIVKYEMAENIPLVP